MTRRGRPIFSVIRQNMIEILFFMKEAYGYEIYKAYRDIYDPITLRVVYYHLKKGKELEEFSVAQVKKTKGEYSWGSDAEKIYYRLGPKAKPKMDTRVKEYLDKKKQEEKENKK